jgi:hypothetical protein
MIERNAEGKLTRNSEAALAIKGMMPGELADKMEMYETQLEQWMGIEVNEDGFVTSERWFTRFRRRIVDSIPYRIFRAELTDLVRGYTRLQQEKKTAGVQQEFYGAYLKLVEDQRGLWRFLYENFRSHLEEGQTLNLSLLDIAKRIMLNSPSAPGDPAARIPDYDSPDVQRQILIAIAELGGDKAPVNTRDVLDHLLSKGIAISTSSEPADPVTASKDPRDDRSAPPAQPESGVAKS